MDEKLILQNLPRAHYIIIHTHIWLKVQAHYSSSDICRCEVLYDYEPQQEDELQISPGDTIYVTEKIDDSWWQGNLNGTLGLFPASYVEEVEAYN